MCVCGVRKIKEKNNFLTYLLIFVLFKYIILIFTVIYNIFINSYLFNIYDLYAFY